MLDFISAPTARIIVVSLLVFSCLLVLCVHLTPSSEGHPRRVRLVGRYPTEKEVISRFYHVHNLPPMNIDLKARYEKRRNLVRYGRRKLQARQSATRPFRQATTDQQEDTGDLRDYLPLLTNKDHGLDLQCGSCSLVANSGYQRQGSMGREIDQSECVFRMGVAPTIGYERDVGRKTTVRVVPHTSVSSLAARSDSLLAQRPSPSHLVFHGPEHVYSSPSILAQLQKIEGANPDVQLYRASAAVEHRADTEFLRHAGKSRFNSSAEFSTNMYALLVMKDMCSSITVYGMLPRSFCSDNPGNKVAFSYYKDPTLTECDMYDFQENVAVGNQPLLAEKRVFESWRTDGSIQFVHPSWE
ncbi:alpha-N-acetylgalactosaminide alpha-2,6-sialyltransferase 3-like [Diadema setosum]|uniref:alpha-N-acetylgalactosaminide alpha-2,6-sialyltransferase 3-like n=1 Tax=Diadema setosum TaxID=31175 RepID=UPI003B3B3155